ncbi:MAG TPA: glycosyltransferase [Puia sp.]|nr:glycosyltransferase [Puia sp.]
MRLLIVGSDKIYAIENFYAKYIAEQGVEVQLFTAQNFFYDYYQRSLANKLIYKTGFSSIIRQINDRLIKVVEEFKPEVVWVFKGMEITPECLLSIKGKNIMLVNYNPDNPFIFSGKGSGNKNVRRSIPLYHLHFTYDASTRLRLEKEFNALTAMLPFGFDVSEDIYQKCQALPEYNKICFLGNPDEPRANALAALLNKGFSVDVYGNNWQKFIEHKNLGIHGPIYGEPFWKALAQYRVQLNLMRIHNKDSHNMRTFEIAGIGGIQLAPATPDHRMFFENEKEIFLFSDMDECAVLARKLLDLPRPEASQIRMRARKRALDSGYGYRDRARSALQRIKNLHG